MAFNMTEELIDEAVEESFPASDPPSYMAGAAVPGPPRRFGRDEKRVNGQGEDDAPLSPRPPTLGRAARGPTGVGSRRAAAPGAQTASHDVIETTRVREAVGVVHSRGQLEALLQSLMTTGFDRSSIDLMASHDAIARKLKTVYRDAAEAAAAPGVPRRRIVMPSDAGSATALVFGTLISIGAIGAALPIVASGGALATAMAAAIGGGAIAGGFAKVVRDRLVDQPDRIDLENELRQEGLVVFVRLRDRRHEKQALALMRECGADKVHVHEVEIAKTLEDIPLADLNPDPLLGSEKLAD